MNELGVGSAPIAQKKLTVEKLAAALREVTQNTEIRRRAMALGEKIGREDGVAKAVGVIEQML